MKSNEISQNGMVHVLITNTTGEIQNIVGTGRCIFYGDWRTGYRPNGIFYLRHKGDSRSITVDTGTSCKFSFSDNLTDYI